MVKINEVKEYLGIVGNDEDVKLSAILGSVNNMVEDFIGDIDEGEKIMFLKRSMIKHNTIPLEIINPIQITEIDGTDFTDKVLGEDYQIYDTGEAYIRNLFNYLSHSSDRFDKIKIKYIAGYDTTPKRLIGAVATYVGYLNSQDNGRDIVSEGIGPRSVAYSENGSQNGVSIEYTNFKGALKKFIPICLRIY